MAREPAREPRRGRLVAVCLSSLLVLGACTGSSEAPPDDGGEQPTGGGGGSSEEAGPDTPAEVAFDEGVVSFAPVDGADHYALVDDVGRWTVGIDACEADRCEIVIQARAGLEQIQVVAVRDGVDSPPSETITLPTEDAAAFEPQPSTYVVRFVDDADEDADSAAEEDHAAEEAAETAPIEVLREEFETEQQAEQHVAEALEEPGVLSAAVERAGDLHAAEASSSQTEGENWHLDALMLDSFDDAVDGGGIVIAVLDTGIDANHPVLAGRVLDGTTTSEPGTPGTSYPRGHGTAVAGFLVGDGIGSAPGAQVLPVDVFGQRDGFTTGDLAWGIVWAVDNGADLINVSVGVTCGDGADECGLELAGIDDAVGYAERNGVLVVTSAGNDGPGAGCETPTNAIRWPATLTLAVTVGGIERDGSRWDCSPDGGHVDTLAPASDLPLLASTHDGGPGRSVGEGTSFAAPLVTGVAARLLSMDRDLSPMVLRMALANHAGDTGAIDVGAVLRLVIALGSVEVPEATDDRATEVEVRRFTLTREGFPELRGEFDTEDPDVTYHGYLTVRQDGTIDGFGRTGGSFERPHEHAWSCGPATRGAYKSWNPVEVSGSVSADGSFDLEFHFPTPGTEGFVREWIIRGDPYCGEIVSEGYERNQARLEAVRDRMNGIRIDGYQTTGASDQTFGIDREEVGLHVSSPQS